MGSATLDGDALTVWLQIRELEQVILPKAPGGGQLGRDTDSQPVLLLHAQNRTEVRTPVCRCGLHLRGPGVCSLHSGGETSVPTPHHGVKEALLARFLFAPAFLTAEALSVEISCQVAEK